MCSKEHNDKIKVLNIMATGSFGGIETLCNNIDKNSSVDNYWCFLFDGGEIANQFKSRNNEKVFILGYNKYKYFKFRKELLDIVKNNKINIITVHHMGTYTNHFYNFLLNRCKNVKGVRYIHSCFDKKSFPTNPLKKIIHTTILKNNLKKSHKIVCVSNAVLNTYKSFYENADKYTVIYNGITDRFFDKNVTKEFSKSNLAYVGRIEETKGIDLLIDAVKKLKDSQYDVSLNIVGQGKCRDSLIEKVNSLGLEECVKFLGAKENVIPYLDRANIFCYPSKWSEAFGISIVEAMARGCVPVAFKIGGIPEIICNNSNGFLGETATCDELVNAITKINKDNFLKLSLNARKTAEMFKLENTIAQLEKLYNELLIK